MSAKRRQSTQRLKGVRVLLNARCDGLCERCGYGLPVNDDGSYLFELHHRLQRSLGGLDTLDNSLAVHPVCHQWIHDHVADALAAGWLLRRVDADEVFISDRLAAWGERDYRIHGQRTERHARWLL